MGGVMCSTRFCRFLKCKVQTNRDYSQTDEIKARSADVGNLGLKKSDPEYNAVLARSDQDNITAL